jgi:hypothetical protein
MDPATAMLIATAVGVGAQGAGSFFSSNNAKKAGKMRAKELKRETLASLLNDSLQGEAELTAHGLSSRSRTGKRRAQSMQDTADLVRGAFNI